MVRQKDPRQRQIAERNRPEGLDDQIKSVLAFAANTNDVIRWDELRALLGASPDPLTDRARVELLLSGVNGDPLRLDEWNGLAGAPLVVSGRPEAIRLPREIRAQLEADLARFVDGSPGVRDRIAATAAALAARSVLIAPTWRGKAGRADRVIAHSAGGGLAYALWLATDPAGPWRDALSRCQLSSCLRFFLRPDPVGPGAPRRAFCRDEHGVLGDREKARARMALLRRGRG